VDPVPLLKGALPPIGAALLLVSLLGGRLLPFAAAAGLYLAYGLLKDWPPLPHELWQKPNGTTWLVWGISALALVATLEHARVLRGRVATTAGAITSALVLWLMLTKLAQRWEAGEAVLHVAVGGVAVALTVAAFRSVIARSPSSTAPAILFALLLSLDAGLVTLGKSALLGQLCGAIAAAVGAAVGTSLWRSGFALRAADGAWIGGAHALFVLAGVHLGYLEWTPACLALAAPLPIWLLRGASNTSSKRWFALAAPLPLAAMVTAMWLAAPEPNAYGY